MPDTAEVTLESIQEALRDVYDPEIPVNVYDLGLVYDIKVTEGQVYVQMTLTAPGCGMGPYIAQNAEWRIAEVEGVLEELAAAGADKAWVTEKYPFLVFLLVGTLPLFLFGDPVGLLLGALGLT